LIHPISRFALSAICAIDEHSLNDGPNRAAATRRQRFSFGFCRSLQMKVGTTRVDGPTGPLTIGYTEWGETHGQAVVCVHGLTRNARDFDALAEALADRWRIVCPDVVGRGRSDRLSDAAHYTVPVYAELLRGFLDRLGLAEVFWVGTSMGGLIGMTLAAQDPTPIGRLVINDVGPFIPKESLAPIQAYLGMELSFASLEEVEEHLRFIHAGFGPLTDAQWRHLTAHSARERDDGRWELSYDPLIRVPFETDAEDDLDLWDAYEAIRCPTLVLRGGDSALLTPETAAEMTRRGPKAELVEFPGIGHAPALMEPDQIEAVRSWLAG
jgi:pimeloyl-ACP methyl ester carboxylesterase